MPSSRRGVVIDRNKRWNALRDGLRRLRRGYVKVGLLDSGEARQDGKLGNVEIGAIHEFGAPSRGIPRRPFLSGAAEAYRNEIATLKAKLAGRFLDGKLSVLQVLGLLGTAHTAQVKRKLTQGPWEALKAATIAARKRRSVGSERPLVDTGQLRNAINYEVVE